MLQDPLKDFKYDPIRIQNRTSGAALKLLYSIKLKKEGTSEKISTDKGQGKAQMSSQNKMTVTGRDIVTQQLEKKLEKFQIAKTQLYKKAADSIAMEKSMKEQTVKNRIHEENKTLKENQKIMKDWIKKGMQNWYKNTQKRKEFINKQQTFKQSVVDKYRAEFEKLLKKKPRSKKRRKKRSRVKVKLQNLIQMKKLKK